MANKASGREDAGVKGTCTRYIHSHPHRLDFAMIDSIRIVVSGLFPLCKSTQMQEQAGVMRL